MTLSSRQKSQLYNIIAQIEKMLAQANAAEKSSSKPRRPAQRVKPNGKTSSQGQSRTRRSRADAAVLRKEIEAARRKGASVPELADKYQVTPSYIYQMR
jgi:hypothetical protein